MNRATVERMAKAIKADAARLVRAAGGKGKALSVEEQARIEIEPTEGSTDVNILSRFFKTPEWIGHRHPAFGRLVKKGMRAVQQQSKNINELRKEYGAVREGLTKAEFGEMGDLIIVGDAEGRQYTRAELEEQGISDKIITAYEGMQRLFTKIGRLVDQHERKMRRQYREQTAGSHGQGPRHGQRRVPQIVRAPRSFARQNPARQRRQP